MSARKTTKYIVVTGGVLSGLGKGIATASLGHLLSSKLKVVPIKCDGYLNTDPGTMNPIEHGEVYVLDDSGEVDMDFGHYERFLGVTCRFEWNLTMGKVFKTILEKERRGDYLGKTVQFIPHVTEVIKDKIYDIADEEKADLVLIEIGGTVGDMENELYLESTRQLAHEVGQSNVVFVHLTYVPIPYGTLEQKSKPTQQSVKILNEKGIRPDIIIGRCREILEDTIKDKIALFCNIEREAVISGLDVKNIYEIPLIYEREGITGIIHKKLGIYSPPDLTRWRVLTERMSHNQTSPKRTATIAICGKYTALGDSYASIIEALNHCGAHFDCRVEVKWLETTDIETGEAEVEAALMGVDGVIVPGGFGLRGIEGKIKVIRHVRESGIPFLGLCYGMHLGVIEYARNVCGLEGAHTTEVESEGIEVSHPVVCILPEQSEVKNKGGTMRLGGHDVILSEGSEARRIHGSKKVRRRFRHRWEINPDYVEQLESAGLVFSGRTPDGTIVQVMELPGHKYFFGCQFHPELTSRLEEPDPLFYNLVGSALELKGDQ
jgi:CTP synthase